MSKSRGNVVNPNDVVAEYGADTMRLYITKPNSSITSKKERTVALCQCHSDERSETVTWHWLG